MRHVCLLGAALVLAACSSSGFQGECDEDGDCEDGFICPRGGAMEGHCTVACEDSGFCESRVGDDSFCHVDNVCVARCDSDSDCPSTLTCSGLPDHCHVPGS